MHDLRTIKPNEDPVCGMQVDIEAARASGRTFSHEGREYVFCGKGCLLEFRDDPNRFLDPGYSPSM
jgi:YHS domain-containing protein